MGDITGGEVAYGRTVKVAEYESKRADVKLSFSAENGKYQQVLDLAMDVAVAKCHDMLGLPSPRLRPIEAAPQNAAADQVAEAAPQSPLGTAVMDRPRRGRPPKAKTENLDPTDPHAADAAAAMPEEKTAAPAAKATDPEDVMGAPEEWDAAPREVSDADLQAACASTNQRTKQPTAIRALIAKFAGPAPKNVRDVPQPVRQQFLDELAKLPAAA